MADSKKDSFNLAFLFGEAFELANYLGIESVARKYNIPVYYETTIYETVNLSSDNWIKYSDLIDQLYGASYEEFRARLKRLKPLNESIDIIQEIPMYHDDLMFFIDIILAHNLENRTHLTKMPAEEQKQIKSELLEPNNAVNLILALRSGFYTGLYFAEWCDFKFKSSFQIHLETQFNPIKEDDSFTRYPDLIITQNEKVAMVGDIKSYLPFYFADHDDKLKHVLNQIPIKDIDITHIFHSYPNSSSISISAFRKRYNFLLRYFKLLYYMNRIYENGDEEYRNKPLLGIILFPTKPVLIKAVNFEDIPKIQQILLNTLPMEISYLISSNGDNLGDINIKDYLWEKERLDLIELLYEGNFFLDLDCDEYFFSIKLYDEENKTRKFLIGKEKKYTASSVPIKTQLGPQTEQGWNKESPDNIRSMHNGLFLSLLNQSSQKNLDVLIDGSDQGTGKNYTFAAYISHLQAKNVIKSFLFACPRKETISTTIESFIHHLKWDHDPNLATQLKIPYSNSRSASSTISTKIENIIRTTDKFEYNNITLRFIKSRHEPSRTINIYGTPHVKRGMPGRSATQQLNSLLRESKSQLEIVFITSQTIPYFLNAQNQKKPYDNYSKLFLRFDDIIFDELTNSDPLVRESFIDLIKVHSLLSVRNENLSNRIIVLDASLLRKNTIRPRSIVFICVIK